MSEILTEIEIISIAQSALKAELTVTAIYEKLAEEFRGKQTG
jgi:hypothetical protein